jgi:hypothetical protein
LVRWQRRHLLQPRLLLLRLRRLHQVVAHPVGLPGLAEQRLEVLPEEVQVVLEVLPEGVQVVLLELEVLLELGVLQVLLVPELLPLVRQAQSPELFLLSALRLLALEWLVWSELQ